jgi:hypothetical protein
MPRRTELFCFLIGLALTAALMPRSPLHAATEAVGAQQSGSVDDLIPLPRGCGGGLPPGQAGAVCCMFGYVLVDGQAVAGARVTITNTANGKSEEVWTEYGPNSPQPYYGISLSDPPLSAQVGNTITVKAEYSGHTRTLTHQALSEGQQVDVVLPRNQADDKVYDRQIWQQAAPGVFNKPGGVAVDNSGTVYMVDSENARVQVFNSSGQFLLQWGRLGGEPGQFSLPNGVSVDQRGNVYVADSGNNRIQKFTSNGTWLASWGSFGTGNSQFDYLRGLSTDSSGNVYVVDHGNHRIQKFNSSGVWLTSWGGLGTANGQFDYPSGVSVDSSGNVYVADSLNHRIQKFTSGGVWLASWGSSGSSDGQFDVPVGVSVDSSGNVYVVESGNHRIQKFSSSGVYLTKWGTFGTGIGQFRWPSSVNVDESTGTVYVIDPSNYRIQKFTKDGIYLTQWSNQGNTNGQFNNPLDVSADSSGNIYVADGGNQRIQKFSSDGTYLTQWGSQGSGNGQFYNPFGVGVDSSGNVYVADTYNNRIQKFSSGGAWIATWGSAGGGDGQFNNPFGVSVDGNGNIYVADTGNNRIQKLSSSGVYLTQWGTYGSALGQLSAPYRVRVDSSGNVYVADSYNNRIQKFSSSGVWLAAWGSLGSGNGQFDTPRGLSIDSNGNIYVADSYNNRIQKFTSDGVYLMQWGSYGGASGQFITPSGVSVDGSGNLFVADSGNNRIQRFRRMSFSAPIATIVAASPRSIVQGQTVALRGMGGDSDATSAIAAYEWTLDGSATPFATTANATASNLSVGQHTIALRVRDTEGEYSAAQSIGVTVSPTPGQAERWTFLLYLAGDNSTAPYLNANTQLGALYRLINGARNPNVTVVALYDGNNTGGGDSFRYVLRPNGSTSQQALGEVNMGNPQTLIDFVAWGKQQAPADHYYLALADHANGLDGIAWDATTAPNEHLTNAELRQALIAISENGSHPIDVLHLDGCLMGLLEIAYQLRSTARYLVSSENEAWSAFAYEVYAKTVGQHTSPAALATVIADSYTQSVAGRPSTIAVLDLSQVNAVVSKTDELAGELLRYALASQGNRAKLTTIRNLAQKFDSSGDIVIANTDEYLDLKDWITHLQQSQNGVNDSAVQSKATALANALPALVVREHHASGIYTDMQIDLEHAHGIAIYYPPQPSTRTYQSYAQGDLTFPRDTRWDEFLAAGLATLPFDPAEPAPNPVAPLGVQQAIYLPLVRR